MLKLQPYYEKDEYIEIGIDEVGRGPMFGRVYCACVILPKNNDFKHENMKDSKKFHSEKKIQETAEYIKQNCIAWSISYSSEEEIDKFNIKQATFMAMHRALKNLIEINKYESYHILVDGNEFKPYIIFNNDTLTPIKHTTIVGGDNKFTSIAAASILAKVERDKYIKELCEKEPLLNEKYDLIKNKGYGTKLHIEGIKKHGISQYHRKSFGLCRNYDT